MISRWSAALTSERSLQLLPFAIAVALLGAMQTRLLPVRPIRMEIPSSIGIPPGAAPQESIAPMTAARPVEPTQVLPRESMPTASAPTNAEPSSATAALGAQRAFPHAGTAEDAWVDRLPREIGTEGAAGNIKARAKQPTAVAALIAGILQSLKRIHPSAVLPAKALAAKMAGVKTTQTHIRLVVPIRANTARPNLPGGEIGGAAPLRNVLGGPAPIAARYAERIDGTSVDRYR